MTTRLEDSTEGSAQTPAHRSFQDRLGAAERRIRRLPPVRGLMGVLDVYNAAGGGLLAAGLAFSGLFAVVPGLLLVVSVLVIVVDDPQTRQDAIDWIVKQVPPLESVAEAIVNGLAESARVGSIVGLIGFIWGASGFYLALEGAMTRLFPGPRSPDPIRSRIKGVAAVLLVVAAVLIAVLGSSLVSVLAQQVDIVNPLDLPFASLVLSVAASSAIVFLTLRLVPANPPSWRAAAVPSLLAGIAMGLLTTLFGLLAPFLVQGFLGLGVIASVFIALVWFNWAFQFMLYGAAFARIRRDADRARAPVM